MLINQDTALSTRQVLLVPYDPHHVPEYHSWMQRPELQELTASEPLSLDEEYAMQLSWRADADKLTFIICLPFADPSVVESVRAGVDDSPDQMIGDINLFVSSDPDKDASTTVSAGPIGEVELMIAKPGATGQGRGRAALLAFLRYVYENQGAICTAFASGQGGAGLREAVDAPRKLGYLRVKIGAGNVKSIGLFQSLGFQGAAEANVFGEVEMRLQGDLETVLKGWDTQWVGSVSGVQTLVYERVMSVQDASAEASEDEEDVEMNG